MFDFIRKAIKPHKHYTKFNVPDTLSHEKTILVDFITVQMAIYGLIFLIVPLFGLFALMTVCTFIYPLKYSIFIMLLAFPVIIFWFFLFGNSAKVDRTTMIIKFYARCFAADPGKGNTFKNTYYKFLNCIKGEHPIIKYKMPDSEFKKHFPIDEIYDNGLISFTDGHFGIMLKVDPPRISSESTYNESMEAVFNSLVYGDMLKFMACSRLDTRKTYTDDIINTANEPGTTPEQKRHLQSIYQDLTTDTQPAIYWQFHAVLVFDAEDKQDADIAVQTRIPGLKSLFNAADVGMYQITNTLDIQLIYLQQLHRKVLKL
jgi:hypothetical protein